MIVINNVPFESHPDIDIPTYPTGKGISYKSDYGMAVAKIKSGEWDEINAYREYILNDLWFLCYFVVKPFIVGTHENFNRPFIVQAVREVEEGPKDYTLDLWARFHYKSTIITIGETIQDILRNPEEATGIFSFKASVAKDFIFSLKQIFEREEILHKCFPDIVFSNPQKDAPLWSIDEGLVLKRKTNRKEANVSGHGLIEGMPTALHFEKRKYDDIITEDIAESIDLMEKVKVKFDSSQNLGTEDGTHRVVGTIYHHNDPHIYIRDKKHAITGEPMYTLRLKPATDNGLENGKPVLLSQKNLDNLKSTKTFRAQQLLNPTPEGTQKLNPDFLNMVNPQFIPRNLYKFMLIDQAGDEESNKSKYTDPWAIWVIGIEPKRDDIGASSRYILDMWSEVSGESEAIEQAIRMYINAGVVQRLGVEKVGISTTHLHIQNALKSKGRYISIENKSLMLLRPSGRNKVKFIESAWAWPLNNGKWFYSEAINHVYVERLKNEMRKFPYWHDDNLNAGAYIDDILKDYNFPYNQYQMKEIKYAPIGV